ncbi:MAG: arginyltransferase [Gammaproteobacteria bacterium]|nr:arginyltransferase [Gammaproteobacteria bacterium]
MNQNEGQPVTLPLYLTPEHPCSYYPEREARTVFADPRLIPDRRAQTEMAEAGFRRSGSYLYRPECEHCSACIPLRVPARGFTPNRSQRRNLRDNADLNISWQRSWCDDELLALYNRYQHWRHPEGDMVAHGAAHFSDFLLSRWADSWFLEIQDEERLVGVLVADRLERGISAVYTFYDPAYEQRGLGSFAILQLIAHARSQGLRDVYLGYWLPGHPKMDYKRKFGPAEYFVEGQWRRAESPQVREKVALHEAMGQNPAPSEETG